jgi:hypothetical protein
VVSRGCKEEEEGVVPTTLAITTGLLLLIHSCTYRVVSRGCKEQEKGVHMNDAIYAVMHCTLS